MMFKVLVLGRFSEEVWATRNQHKLIGFLIGVAMARNFSVKDAAQMANDALNTTFAGVEYQGIFCRVWQEHGTDFDPVQG